MRRCWIVAELDFVHRRIDWLYVKKPTRFRSTSRKVVEAVNLRLPVWRTRAHPDVRKRSSV